MIKNILRVDLNLFDGGAAAGAGDGSGTAAGDGSAQGDTHGAPAATRRGKSGEYANVVFGKQPGATAQGSAANTAADASHAAGEDKAKGTQTSSDTLDERRKAFNELITGDYKDVYAEETQRIINRRFKETRNLEAQLQKNQPVIDMLMQRYNISDGDIGKLTSAIENDDAYWSEAAEEAGMSVEQYKKFQKLERENAALMQEQRMRQGQQKANEQLQKWYSEAEAIKKTFPGFDLNAEVKNPQFVSMLKSGVPVEHAYKVIHFDEIMTNTMQTTAQRTEKRVADSVRANGQRPIENGTAAQSAFTVKDDVSKLTKKDRAEIARRVARGEKISF